MSRRTFDFRGLKTSLSPSPWERSFSLPETALINLGFFPFVFFPGSGEEHGDTKSALASSPSDRLCGNETPWEEPDFFDESREMTSCLLERMVKLLGRTPLGMDEASDTLTDESMWSMEEASAPSGCDLERAGRAEEEEE